MCICLIATVSMAAMAGDDLKVKRGDFKEFKNGGIGIVNFDLSNAKYDNKKDLIREYPNLNNLMQGVQREFIREFNDEAKRFRIVESSDTDCYVINITINNVDRYYNAFSFKPGITTKLFGEIEILAPDGREVCYVIIDDLQNTGIGNDESFEEAFEELGETLAKRINKAK